jgi:lipopolysaccharide transport system ATP-binding protein
MKPIIEVRHLSKEYRIGANFQRTETFRELITRMFTAKLKGKSDETPGEHKFWALRDVNFDVQQGEVIGIIGRNGAGKSTMLKILSRITDPTLGEIHIRGRLASLLEVGTGFHPELTGRENIYLNGAILGMRKTEIVAKFDEIVAFAEIEKFLDTPVKHYSSGMYVRLAFAVAAHLDPEILIVDEVLAVGDMAFQKKCLGKMGEVSRGGRTVLFVSHNMAAVENLCQRGIVLERGQLLFDGSAKQAVQRYLEYASGGQGASGHIIDLDEESVGERRSPMGRLLRKVELYTDGNRPLQDALPLGASLKIKIHFDLPRATDSFNIGIGFNDIYNQRVFIANSSFEPDRSHGAREGRQVFVCEIPSFQLVPGEYSILLWLDITNAKADFIENGIRISVIESDYYGTGKAPRTGICVMPQRWQLEEVTESLPVAAAISTAR